ncbi:MAG: DUF2794 domain-containing protein, partial [Caulobacteraceae bacterium]
MVIDPAQIAPPSGGGATVFFDRRELTQLLGVYGRMVALGHWRD